MFGWNEGAGVVMAERGWALTDRPSLVFSGLGQRRPDLYYEFDGRPGAYAGLMWRHHEQLELRALYYDNRADPAAQNTEGDAGWHTTFSTTGARWEPLDNLTVVAQELQGRTAVGPNGSDEQFNLRFSTWYALASFDYRRERLSVRFDRFSTHQESGFYGPPPADETGHAFTVALMHRLSERWELAAEWLRVNSQFPPRIDAGLPAASTDTQIQLAVRYRFRLEV